MKRDDQVEWYEMEQAMRRPSPDSQVEIARMKSMYDKLSKDPSDQ